MTTEVLRKVVAAWKKNRNGGHPFEIRIDPVFRNVLVSEETVQVEEIDLSYL